MKRQGTNETIQFEQLKKLVMIVICELSKQGKSSIRDSNIITELKAKHGVVSESGDAETIGSLLQELAGEKFIESEVHGGFETGYKLASRGLEICNKMNS